MAKKQQFIQYKVPQNVQREDTIIGPLTMRHMIILGIGGGIAYAVYVSLAKTYYIQVWLPPVAIISAITLAFAFLKIHSLDFHIFLMDLLEYNLLAKKRIWIQGTGYPFVSTFQREEAQRTKEKEKMEKKTQKDIKELAKILGTREKGESKTEEKEEEITKEEKKGELKKIIEKNYQ